MDVYLTKIRYNTYYKNTYAQLMKCDDDSLVVASDLKYILAVIMDENRRYSLTNGKIKKFFRDGKEHYTLYID